MDLPLTDDDLEARIDRLTAELAAADWRLREIYRALAADPDRDVELAPRITKVRDERATLGRELGLALAAWLHAGGDIVLRPAPLAKGPHADDSPSASAAPAVTGAPSSEAPVNPSVSEAIEPPTPSVNAEQRERFAARVNANGLSGLTRSDAVQTPFETLRSLLAAVGPPPGASSSLFEVIDEVDRLDEVSDAEHIGAWDRMTRDAQRSWVALLAARARTVKMSPLLPQGAKEKMRVMIVRLPEWVSRHTVGHVHGLAVTHEPVSGAWWRDAEHLWNELDELASGTAAAGEWAAAFDRAIPKPAPSARGSEAGKKEEREAPIEAAWPLWDRVRGKRALMIGGTAREERRVALERAFSLAELEWVNSDGPRKIDAAVGRIESGSVELVLVIQNLVFHKDSDRIRDAARASGAAWAMVSGYGVSGVRQGIERFLAGALGNGNESVTTK